MRRRDRGGLTAGVGVRVREPEELLPPKGPSPADRPAITVSYAQSLDGSIAQNPGEPLRLSGSRSLELTHRLRAAHDAILVGIGTVLADDPRLNVRRAAGRSPLPVVLDSRLRTPEVARLLSERRAPVLIAATEGADPATRERLEVLGAIVLVFPPEQGRVPLRPLFRALRERGVRRMLVEGGGQVLTSLFAERLLDQVVITVAPRLIGGEPALFRMGAPVELEGLRWARLDDDLVFCGRPRFEEAPAGRTSDPVASP